MGDRVVGMHQPNFVPWLGFSTSWRMLMSSSCWIRFNSAVGATLTAWAFAPLREPSG